MMQWFDVALRFKTFVQILMAVLALGISLPQPACAVGKSEPGKACCCCADDQACASHSGTPCPNACALTTAQPLDKQAPGRMASVPSPGMGLLLFSIVPNRVNYFSPLPHASSWGVNASRFLASSPPQAALCLWRI